MSKLFRRRLAIFPLNNINLTHRHKHSQSLEYCINLVRKHDYEGYLCTLLLPEEIRRPGFAIRAFNTELAMVRDQVSNRHLGLMRLQFWKDALNKLNKGQKPPAHPVAEELHHAKQTYFLSNMWLSRLIDTRETALDDKPFNALEDLEKYSENSVSSLHYLILQTLDITDVKADHSSSHLGKGQGLSNHLRGICHNAAKGCVNVPLTLLAKHGVSQEDILRGKASQQMNDLTFEIASAAHEHLLKVEDLKQESPIGSQSAFLPLVCCNNFLKRLEKLHFNVFDPKLQRRNNLLPLKLYWAHLNRNRTGIRT